MNPGNNTDGTEFTGINEIKEEYEDAAEDTNVSVCLEEDSTDLHTLEAIPEDLQGSIDALNDIPVNPPEEVIEEIGGESEEEIPIGLRTKPTRRSARVRVKSAKRRIENVFEDSEAESEDDDEDVEYSYRQPALIESYIDKPVFDEAKLDKIVGKVDPENLDPELGGFSN